MGLRAGSARVCVMSLAMTACSLLTSLDDLRQPNSGDAAADGALDAAIDATDAAVEAAQEAEAGPPPCGAPGETCCAAPLAPCEDGLACGKTNACMVADAWAVGAYTTVASSTFVTEIVAAHYDGTAWTLVKPVNVDTGFASSYAIDIYQHDAQVNVLTDEANVGTMYRWNTVGWTVCKTGNSCVGPTPSSTSLWAVTAVLDNGLVDYWVAGTNLMDVCPEGSSSCSSKTTGITGSWGTGNFAGQTTQDLWYSVFDHVLHFDGTTWTLTSVADARTIADVGTNDLWIGDQQLRHYDGKAWSNAYLVDGAKTPGYIYSISGAASGDVFAVGNGNGTSFAAHWDGAAWKATALPSTIAGVQKVWAPSRLEAFVVGGRSTSSNTGVIARWDGQAWTEMPSPSVTYSGEQQPGVLAWVSVTGRARPRRN